MLFSFRQYRWPGARSRLTTVNYYYFPNPRPVVFTRNFFRNINIVRASEQVVTSITVFPGRDQRRGRCLKVGGGQRRDPRGAAPTYMCVCKCRVGDETRWTKLTADDRRVSPPSCNVSEKERKKIYVRRALVSLDDTENEKTKTVDDWCNPFRGARRPYRRSPNVTRTKYSFSKQQRRKTFLARARVSCPVVRLWNGTLVRSPVQ